MNGRYEGKPFLRLLECYVLWSIDQLPDDQEEHLKGMTPNLTSTFGIDGPWQSIVATQMDFPAHLASELRRMWDRSVADSNAQGGVIDPETWAQRIVDTNFV